MAESDKLALVANVASSYLRRNAVGVDQIGSVFSAVSKALDSAAKEISGEAAPAEAPAPAANQAPAVPVKRSVQRDYIVCLEDGAHVRTLKRHLMSAHGLTPKDYRQKWNLPRDYPMTAPAYSEHRSELAKARGLGRKPGATAKRGRKASA
jgi:predicted transcriptional regulator